MVAVLVWHEQLHVRAAVDDLPREPPLVIELGAVDLDPESEVIATIGSKEGLAHLAFATLYGTQSRWSVGTEYLVLELLGGEISLPIVLQPAEPEFERVRGIDALWSV